MKKIISIMLAAIMLVALVSCGAKNEPAAEEPSAEPAKESAPAQETGGWTIPESFNDFEIPAEAKEAFDKALESYTGAGFEPIAYLGSQVVAGANFKFLCKTTLVTAEPVTKLCVVTVYRDLDKNASISNTEDVDIVSLKGEGTGVEFGDAKLVGGYTLESVCGAGLDDKAQKAFDKASASLDVKYTPLVCMGKQVVAGQNYIILCKAVSGESSVLAAVTVYADLSDGAEVTGVTVFPY